MKVKLYSIYDKVGGTYADIKLFNNEDLAKRWFNHFKTESPFGADLDLYYLGEYNLDTGVITALKPDFVGV